MVVNRGKMTSGKCHRGVSKDYESLIVKKYDEENDMRVTAIYADERTQLWMNAKNICEIGMIKEKSISFSPIIEEIGNDCDKYKNWILNAIRKIRELRINGHYGYNAQRLYDIEKYLKKMQEMLGDLRYELC